MESNTREDADKCQSEGDTEKIKKIYNSASTFIFLIRGRNCEKTIEKCLRSIRRQTYPHWIALIVLDAPTDNSEHLIKKLIKDDDRFKLIVNNKNYGVCKNMYYIVRCALKTFNPDDRDIASIVDADDWISKDALKSVANVFKKHSDTYITHGSYKKMSKNRRTKISKPYPKRGNIRKLPWRGSHMKCIKWKIIKQAKPQWFQHNGKWLEAASDLALMFNCVELAGLKRVRHVHKIIYYWNNHTTKKKRRLQKKCEKILRNK
jgi:glycosyltransferase involved in cell wall biosynthesis